MKLTQRCTSAVNFTALLMVMFCTVAFANDSFGNAAATPHGDTIYIQKNTVNKLHRVSIYPDASQKVVFFSVRGQEGKVYQLYVFDVDGKLVRQTETRNKQTTILKHIEKGVYFFEVFSDDLRIGNGQIAVR
jgi:hypothetical protein